MADGSCADCGETLAGDYSNQYSFRIPDGPIEWTPESGAEIAIKFDAKIFAGFVLKLHLNCNGVLTSTNGATISYTLEVGCWDGGTTAPPSGDGSQIDEDIWELHASELLSGDDMRTNINDGTITVKLSEFAGEFPYSGDYSETLIFSVTLEEETV